MRVFLYAWLFVAAISAGLSCSPRPEGEAYTEAIDIASDPLQTPAVDAEPIPADIDGYKINIRPQAEYRLCGIVLGRKNYASGWNSTISPCDMAVAWGKMVVTGLYRKVTWSQGGRWYYWRYDDEFPFDNTFIARYSANIHVIPANRNVRAAVMSVSAGDTVSADGFLVYVIAGKDGNDYWWNSSLSRQDTGDGSCEVMYIRRIAFKGVSYR